MTDLIEVRTRDLAGEALGWAVAQAEGLQAHIEPPQYGNPSRVFVRRADEATSRLDRYNPQEDWGLGGQLIEKYRFGFGLYSDSFFAVTGLDDAPGEADGSTHLISACRAIVAARLGDPVLIPRELLP